MKEKGKPDKSLSYVRHNYIEVDTEEDRNTLRQKAANFTLGRSLTQKELRTLRVWREQEPELTVGEPPGPNVGFHFRAHFSRLSVTEFFSKEGKIGEPQADIIFDLYSNKASLLEWKH